MTDPGHPFAVPYPALIASLEDSIRAGVPQPARQRFVFQGAVTAYELRRDVHEVLRVTEVRGTTPVVYEPGVHFRRADNRIVWIHSTEHPADGKRFEVEYTYRERPAGLTDFNPGSVVGTLVRAVARELKLQYDQMDEAYRRAFIDQATGVALDNVVALLGIERNPALPAQGFVTFFRKTAADRSYTVPAGTRVTDAAGRAYLTDGAGELPAGVIAERARSQDGAVTVARRIARLDGVWAEDADPDTADPLPDAAVGDDERTVTLGAGAPAAVLVRYVAKGVTVPVTAAQPGPEGNVNAGAIAIMPTPPTGIEGVVNEEPVAGGKAAEGDAQLRQRARFHLERLGNATPNALRFAVLEVDGVDAAEVADHATDPSIPLGDVRITYSGGDRAQVEAAVEKTRAAGVLARAREIDQLRVGGTWYVLPEPGMPADAPARFAAALAAALDAGEIGAPASLRRLNALVYDVAGLADVAEARLTREGAALPDPFVVERTEVVRADPAALAVRVLAALEAAGPATHAAGASTVPLRLRTSAGPAEFTDFGLDLAVEFRARLAAAPSDAPRAFAGSLARRVAFREGTTAELRIQDAEITGYDPLVHAPEVEAAVRAAAYPGVQALAVLLDLG